MPSNVTLVSSEHPLNALFPMYLHVLGIVIEVIDEQSRKASEPIFVVFVGILRVDILPHDLNAFDGISLMLSESVADVVSYQFSNTAVPMDVTDCGSATFANLTILRETTPSF